MSRRTTIHIHGKPYWVTRTPKGRFKNVVDISRAIRRDIKQHAKRVVAPGFGYMGDQKRRSR